MNDGEIREVLTSIQDRSREAGLPGLGPFDLVRADDERIPDARGTLLLYLRLLRERAALRSSHMSDATLRALQTSLASGTQSLDGVFVETDERTREAFGLPPRLALSGSERASETLALIDRLFGEIAEDADDTP